MKRRLKFLATLGLVSVLATGCYLPHTLVEFSPVQPPPQYENWKIHVWVEATSCCLPTTNRSYRVGASAWTVHGDTYHGNPSEFQASAYDATIHSLRLFWVEGTNAIELSLQEIGPSTWRSTSSQWLIVESKKVDIPTSVRELRAVLAMTFWNRETGQTEVKTIDLRMIKGTRIKCVPLMVEAQTSHHQV